MKTREKIAALRKSMKEHGIDAYYIPSVDPHQSEYLPECWKRRAWLSGFTGSAGDLLVTARKAGLWTDGRYFLQASIELEGSGIALMKMGLPETPDLVDWAARQLKRGQTLGVDPQVLSVNAAERFEETLGEKGIDVAYLNRNLVDALWRDQPEPSLAPLKAHSSRYAGETTASKLRRLREAMKEQGVKAHVLGALDAIAWLLNIRSADIEYTPVAIAYALVTDRKAVLFIDPRKVSKNLRKSLRRHFQIQPYRDFKRALRDLGRQRTAILVDPATTNRWVVDMLGRAEIVYATSPIVAMKAIKNPVQIEGITAAHVRDGVAMVKFLKWLDERVKQGGVTEMSAAARLERFRAEDRMFKDCSFATISGYAAHGAIIHYSADADSDVELKPRGLYLIDSGGQYPDGTTDITRTVLLGGKPTRRQKEMFTRVLRGNIRCTLTPFPAGTTGQRHELFARQPLWEGGANYNHGTGHGVGQYLGVHEGPCSLKDIPTVPLQPGHLLSIEPGYYEDGKFGIRIENLAFVVRDAKLSRRGQQWYRFEPVTLCPIDRKLIDRKLLTADERAWLNAYHQRVQRTLSRYLDREHRDWLHRATRPL